MAIKGGTKSGLKAQTNAELLSYIINQTPELQSLSLPRQGHHEDVRKIGEIIINNQRYRNAFINAVNLIGLIVIKRNAWTDYWDFTERGELRFGQTVEEIVHDLANVYDYNENFDNNLRFVETAVPNIFTYIHNINFQKFYETTTNDELTAMAFYNEFGLFELIDESIGMLYESYKYDSFLINKYMIQKRIAKGTVTSVSITDFDTRTPRQRVSFMKMYSNRMSFRSPNFNPAGIRRATDFSNQILIVSSKFEADFSTEVLSTSFFKDEAEYRARLVLIDTFSTTDKARLKELLGSEYEEFSAEEEEIFDNIPAILISREWFMNYNYTISTEGANLAATQFYNPTTKNNNHFLHVWAIKSTSPFENAIVFTNNVTPSVTSVSISPTALKTDPNFTNDYQFIATVNTEGFANQAVVWSLDSVTGFTDKNPSYISQDGKLHYKAYNNESGTWRITATSIFDSTKYASVEVDMQDSAVASI